VLDIYFSPSVALDPEIIRSHLEKNLSAEVHAVWLVARTGGLVETKVPDEGFRKTNVLGDDVIWFGTLVNVLHRSVIEFFLETPVGENWLNSWGGSWSKSYQNFAYGKLRCALLLSPHAGNERRVQFYQGPSMRQNRSDTVTQMFEAATKAETHSGLAQSQLVSDIDTSLSAHWWDREMYDLEDGETHFPQFAQTHRSKGFNWIASYVSDCRSVWARFSIGVLVHAIGPFGIDVTDLAILFCLSQYVIKEVTDCVQKSTIEDDVQSLLNKRLLVICCCNCAQWSEQDFESYAKLVVIFLRLGANPNFEDGTGHTTFQLLCRALGSYAAGDMFHRRFGYGYVAQSKGCLPPITEIIEAFMQYGADASRTIHLFSFTNRGSPIYIQVGILELVGILYGRHVNGRPTVMPQSFTDLLKSRGAIPCFTVERATDEVGIERASSDDFSAKLLHLLQSWESYPDGNFEVSYERIEPAGSWEVIHRHDHTANCVICEHVYRNGRGLFENFPQKGDQDYEDFWFAATTPHDLDEEYSDPHSPGLD